MGDQARSETGSARQPGERHVDVAARLRATAAARPDRIALLWHDRRVTYAELDASADAGAAALQQLGVEPGDRVAVLLGNVPAFVTAYFAVLRVGGVVVPLDVGLAPDEVEHVLTDSGAAVVIAGAEHTTTVMALRGRVATLLEVVIAGGEPAEGLRGWRDLLEAHRTGRPFAPAERGPDDLAALVYTSGTTGRPRGAMLTHANLAANQDQSLAGRFRVEGDDVVLLVLPLSHIYALNVGLGASVRVGATMLLVERFEPLASLEAIERFGVTIVLGAPPMYHAWLDTPGAEEHDLSSVRLAVSGAAPLPLAVLRRFEDVHGIEINEGYGLTEASPSVASNAMADRARPGSVGLPVPDLELRLVDDDGRDVEPGDPGEIWVRGPNVFRGYWNQPDDDTLTPDGWLRTGDIGTRDEDGFLYLVDRKGDLIIVSGFNVYPREVERVLQQHEAVSECAVVGVPHPHSGEAVKAFVVPRPGTDPRTDELRAFTHSRLARYKCPETVELVPELPHTATGKIRRVALREGV